MDRNTLTAPTAVIADDEPLLRTRLEQMLTTLWPELSIVATARNGREAITEIETQRPTVAFLDIHMPLLTGLEAAQRCAGGDTHFVFVTAFEEHAVKAFEAGAIDYIVKPLDEERLALSVNRLKERVSAPPNDIREWLEQFAKGMPAAKQYLQWIRASVGSQVRLVQTSEVLFFQADDKYTRVVTANGEHVIRKGVRELLDELDPDRFVQIHRSTIVNLHAIDHVLRHPIDYWEIKVKGSSEVLRVSRTFIHRFKQM
jgi:DNA-binding LytR/AlgR family response regulator